MTHNYYDQNSIPMEMGQHFAEPEFHNNFQLHQPQFQRNVTQEEIIGQQNFQNEMTPNIIPPRNHRSKREIIFLRV